MARPTANLRLFVAVYPPLDVAKAMLSAAATLDLPERRITPAAQVHMTIHFIGDRPVREMEHVTESFRRATGGLPPFALTPEALIPLPSARQARLLALRTDAPATLLELKRRLATRFVRAGRRDGADSFLPHLTLYRFRDPAHSLGPAPGPGSEEIPAIPAETPVTDVAPFEVGRALLMRSTLAPGGATHHVVDAAALEG